MKPLEELTKKEFRNLLLGRNSIDSLQSGTESSKTEFYCLDLDGKIQLISRYSKDSPPPIPKKSIEQLAQNLSIKPLVAVDNFIKRQTDFFKKDIPKQKIVTRTLYFQLLDQLYQQKKFQEIVAIMFQLEKENKKTDAALYYAYLAAIPEYGIPVDEEQKKFSRMFKQDVINKLTDEGIERPQLLSVILGQGKEVNLDQYCQVHNDLVLKEQMQEPSQLSSSTEGVKERPTKTKTLPQPSRLSWSWPWSKKEEKKESGTEMQNIKKDKP